MDTGEKAAALASLANSVSLSAVVNAASHVTVCGAACANARDPADGSAGCNAYAVDDAANECRFGITTAAFVAGLGGAGAERFYSTIAKP